MRFLVLVLSIAVLGLVLDRPPETESVRWIHRANIDRKSIDIESHVVKDWIGHLRPFEHQDRFTEHEYGEIWPDARATHQC